MTADSPLPICARMSATAAAIAANETSANPEKRARALIDRIPAEIGPREGYKSRKAEA